MSPVPMPKRYVIEMFCDRMAASKIYMKENYTDRSPLEYFNQRKDHRAIHPDTVEELSTLLTMLAEKGERETFSYIRKLPKK